MNNTAHEQYMVRLRGALLSPRGFRVAVGNIRFQAVEQHNKRHTMNIGLVHSSTPHTHYAALTTTNRFASPPVETLQRMRARGYIQTLAVNNTISNAGSKAGHENMRHIQRQLSRLLNTAPRAIIPVSTGIIGWTLPIQEICAALPTLVARLGSDSFVDFAQAIMTTDRFVKVRSCRYEDGIIVGVCKGAGMIEPNLRTMLVFFFTDLAFSNSALHRALSHATRESFDQISVDGDQSTSDIAMIQSSCMVKGVPARGFARQVLTLARDLALDVVRNGEGVGHLLKITVSGASHNARARELAKFLLHSRLIATAIAGDDPNLGRIVARIGQYFGMIKKRINFSRVTIHIEGKLVFTKGHFLLSPALEKAIAAAFLKKRWDSHINGYPIVKAPIELVTRIGPGRGTATVYGGDLTKEYVHINADYRS